MNDKANDTLKQIEDLMHENNGDCWVTIQEMPATEFINMYGLQPKAIIRLIKKGE